MTVYATDAGVKQLLRTSDDQTFGTDETARITALLPVASLAIDHATGATFASSSPSATARDVEGEGGRLLFLPTGVRTVSSVVEAPAWDGSAWTGGVTLTASQYRLTSQVANGAYRTLTRTDGGWSCGLRYVVTAVWEDTYDTIPADITYIANFVAAEIFKAQQASPSGLLGPEGALVPIRKALEIDEVKKVIAFYRVGPGMWVV